MITLENVDITIPNSYNPHFSELEKVNIYKIRRIALYQGFYRLLKNSIKKGSSKRV